MSDPVDQRRRRLLGAAAASLAAGRLGVLGAAAQQLACAASASGASMPSLAGATEWLNSPPLTAAAPAREGRPRRRSGRTRASTGCARCPTCARGPTKYTDQGLVVIGVHSPEFAFEKDVDNVRRAVTDMRVDYPVAIDSDYAIWRAFGNEYWPALYFVDAQGRIRHHQFGEGEYEQSERMIQQLLAEAGARPATAATLASVDARRRRGRRRLGQPAVAGELRRLRAHRELRLARRRGARPAAHATRCPARCALNQWALAGDWTVGAQATVLERAQRADRATASTRATCIS